MRGQADLFSGLDGPAAPIEIKPSGQIRTAPETKRRSWTLDPADYESAAQILEASGNYRVLRRLEPRPVCMPRAPVDGERIAVIVDTEPRALITPGMR